MRNDGLKITKTLFETKSFGKLLLNMRNDGLKITKTLFETKSFGKYSVQNI